MSITLRRGRLLLENIVSTPIHPRPSPTDGSLNISVDHYIPYKYYTHRYYIIRRVIDYLYVFLLTSYASSEASILFGSNRFSLATAYIHANIFYGFSRAIFYIFSLAYDNNFSDYIPANEIIECPTIIVYCISVGLRSDWVLKGLVVLDL